MVSMLVLALHTAYLASLVWPGVSSEQQMWLALAAYAAYVVNAAQFVIKLRQARLESPKVGQLQEARS
jgi:3-vinyl bacteriochlorophyllide hydratase